MSETPSVVDGRSSGHEPIDDDLDDIRSDPHCRYLLEYLRRNEGRGSVSTVTRHVAAEITDTSPDRVPADIQRRVETWLHHGQLPALDAHGIVEFDPDSGTVRLAGDVE